MVKDKYLASSRSKLKDFVVGRAFWFYQAPMALLVRPVTNSRDFIFVCGCGHSGTSLMAARIGQHPEAYLVDQESAAFLPPRGLYVSKQLVLQWRNLAIKHSKTRIVEKTPKHVQRISVMRQLLPDARFVIMVRNPLDNIASLYKRFGNLDGAIDRWLWDNQEAWKSSRNRPFSIRIVKYEELTANPSKELKSIASWLNFGWDESMGMAKEGAYRSSKNGSNMMLRAEQISQGIKTRIGTWERILDSGAARYVWRRTAQLATTLGYTEPNGSTFQG